MTTAFLVLSGSVLILLFVIAAGRPKLIVAMAFVGLISARTLGQATRISAIGYLDELIVGVLFTWLVVVPFIMGRRVRSFPGLWWFGLFAVFGFIGSYAADVPPEWAAASAFLAIKGVLFGWSIAQLDWTERDIRLAARLAAGILVFVLLGGLVNLAVPEAWASVLANDGTVNYRAAVPSIIGPFVHPGEFGVATALGAIAVAAWIATHGATGRNVLLLVATIIGCLVSFRRKSVVGAAVALAWLGLKTHRTRTVLVMALAAPIILVGLWTTLQNIVTYTEREYLARPHENARIVLTLGAFDVANEYFPLGAGFGMYGSHMAQANYSPEYSSRRFDVVWGLGTNEDDGFALTDTMWPAILGEGGYGGAAAFAVGLVMIYRGGMRHQRAPNDDVRWLALVVGGWSIELAFESVALAAYSAPPVFPLLMGAAGMLYAVTDREDVTSRGDGPEGRPDWGRGLRGAEPPPGGFIAFREGRSR